MPKKRGAPRREMVETQGVLNDRLLAALGRKSSLSELDALWERGSRVDEAGLQSAAECGSAQGLRWVLSKLPEPGDEEAREIRGAALWWALVMGSGGPAKVSALIKALGLPRGIEPHEEHSARRALEAAAQSSDGAFRLLLDAVEPPPAKELAREMMKGDYLAAAAERSAARVRMALEHPKHGPAMSALRRGVALRAALRLGAQGGAEGMEVVQALFETAQLSGAGLSMSAVAVAGVYGQNQALAWMLESSDGRVGRGEAMEAAQRAQEAGNEEGAGLLRGWLLAQEERGEMERAAGGAKRARPAPRV